FGAAPGVVPVADPGVVPLALVAAGAPVPAGVVVTGFVGAFAGAVADVAGVVPAVAGGADGGAVVTGSGAGGGGVVAGGGAGCALTVVVVAGSALRDRIHIVIPTTATRMTMPAAAATSVQFDCFAEGGGSDAAGTGAAPVAAF